MKFAKYSHMLKFHDIRYKNCAITCVCNLMPSPPPALPPPPPPPPLPFPSPPPPLSPTECSFVLLSCTQHHTRSQSLLYSMQLLAQWHRSRGGERRRRNLKLRTLSQSRRAVKYWAAAPVCTGLSLRARWVQCV